MANTQWIAKTAKLLNDEKLASVLVRLMMVINDIGITNSEMIAWQATEDPKKKLRWRGAVLYFGRVQSAHLFEALSIIHEIKTDTELRARVEKCPKIINDYFDTIASFLNSSDYRLMAQIRNNVAFHYNSTLTMRRLKRLVENNPDHQFSYSMGTETLDWYFELGDLVVDDVLIRDIFKIDEKDDIATAALEVMNRLHVIGDAFTRFAPYFIRECCKR